MAKTKKTAVEESIEKTLWKAADKLRKNIDAAEYKHICPGLIFLKYISDASEELFLKLKEAQGDYKGADPGDKEAATLGHVLIPGRYVGLHDGVDDFNFEERFISFMAELEGQMEEEIKLNEIIKQYLLGKK